MKNRGVTIGGFHTFRDFDLHWIRYEISEPEPITHYIDIPGRKTKIDATESLYGDTTYENRTLTFYLWMKAKHSKWQNMDSRIQRAIGGKRCKIILDTEPDKFWMGRVTVASRKEEETQHILAFYTITCDVEPYKYWTSDDSEDWLWDPFSFMDGVIQPLTNIQVTGTKTVHVMGNDMLPYPEITSSATMTIRIDGKTYSLNRNQPLAIEDVRIGTEGKDITFNSSGTVSIILKGETL